MVDTGGLRAALLKIDHSGSDSRSEYLLAMATETEVAGIMLLDRGEHGFELGGDADSLRRLADALTDADAVQIRDERGAASIQVRRSGDLLLIHHGESEVTIAGQQRRLDDLAAAIRFVAAGPAQPSSVQFHTHVEWYAGHPWLDPGSEPVVVYLTD